MPMPIIFFAVTRMTSGNPIKWKWKCGKWQSSSRQILPCVFWFSDMMAIDEMGNVQNDSVWQQLHLHPDFLHSTDCWYRIFHMDAPPC